MSDRRSEKYPHIPAGRYAVDDPDGRLTFWSVDSAGALRDYPPGTRWQPTPPPLPPGLPREERQERRDRWYSDVYWSYKDAVVAAISADPDGARQRFDAESPHAEPPPASPPRGRRHRPAQPRTRKTTAAHRRRASEALAAAALRQTGMSYRQIAGTLELPVMTAFRRVERAGWIDGLTREGMMSDMRQRDT